MKPKVFLSYTWEGESHRHWVQQLAERLSNDGVDVILDQWHAVPGDILPHFMEKSVREADFVLIICTPKYKSKSDFRVGGVGYEGDIMTGEILAHTRRNKFIPILRVSNWRDAAPSWLLGSYYIDLSGTEFPEKAYKELLQTLLGKLAFPPNAGSKLTIHGDINRRLLNQLDVTDRNGTTFSLTGRLLTKLLIEVLGFPSLFEIASRVEIAAAKLGQRYRDVNSPSSLWSAVLGREQRSENTHWDMRSRYQTSKHASLGPGFAVTLQHVQLTQFINRTPGRHFVLPQWFAPRDMDGSPNRHYGSGDVNTPDVALPADIMLVENIAVRRMGLGDLRLGSRNQLSLLNAVDTWSFAGGRGAVDISEQYSPARISPRQFECPPWAGHCTTALGFPVLVSPLVLDLIHPLLEEYGAVYVSTLTGILCGPEDFPELKWSPGVPRVALLVLDRKNIGEARKPCIPIFCSAWTAGAASDGRVVTYGHWPFPVGTKHFREYIRGATSIIGEEFSRRALTPVFEFDETVNWFGDDTPIDPKGVWSVYSSLNERSDILTGLWMNEQVEIRQACNEDLFSPRASGLAGPLTSRPRSIKEAFERLADARSLDLLNEHDRALEQCKRVISEAPAVNWAWMLRSVVEFRAGNCEEAAKSAFKCLELAADVGRVLHPVPDTAMILAVLWNEMIATPSHPARSTRISRKRVEDNSIKLHISLRMLRFLISEEFPQCESCLLPRLPTLSRMRDVLRAISDDAVVGIAEHGLDGILFMTNGGGAILRNGNQWSRVPLSGSGEIRYSAHGACAASVDCTWLALGQNGAIEIHGEHVKHYPAEELAGSYSVAHKVTRDIAGRTWIAFRDSGIGFFEETKFYRMHKGNGVLPVDHIGAIYVARDGAIWITWGDLNGPQGVSVFRRGKWMHVQRKMDEQFYSPERDLIFELPDTSICIVTTEFVHTHHDGRWHEDRIPYTKHMKELNAKLRGLRHRQAWGGRWNGPIPIPVAAMIGKSGPVLLATSCGLFERDLGEGCDWKEWHGHNARVDIAGINCVLQGGEDVVYVGTERGLFRIVLGQCGILKSENLGPESDPNVTAVALIDDVIWVGTENGSIYSYSNEGWRDWSEHSSVYDFTDREGEIFLNFTDSRALP